MTDYYDGKVMVLSVKVILFLSLNRSNDGKSGGRVLRWKATGSVLWCLVLLDVNECTFGCWEGLVGEKSW